MSSPTTGVDPTDHVFIDPIFISYRQSDGSPITAELAWLLRAAGIPVWRDRDDLPPGDTETRLRQAITDGLSGAVLVITPDVANSESVRYVEAAELIALHKKQPAFALGITNAIERAPGKLDYEAPDTVLGLRPGTLTGVDQHPSDRPGLLLLLQKLLWHRIAHQRALVEHADGNFTLSIQTRNTPQVYDRTGSQLDIRIRPSEHERLPSPEGLQDLADVIELLPSAVTRAGARSVRITGGAHLSVALALGAALPSSRIGRLEVIDQRGEPWTSDREAHQPDTPRLATVTHGTNPTPAPAGRPVVGVYLDLIPQRSDAAYDRYLEENQSTLTAWAHLRPTTDDLLDPTTAGQLAAEAAAHIRDISNTNANAEVHLLLRCPFPIAVLIGRLMNTLRLVTYEWDDSAPTTGHDYRPRYVPTISVRASAAPGVIDTVHLTS
jgi:SMODS-associated and fused to various effectors sensor domain/TIR domain